MEPSIAEKIANKLIKEHIIPEPEWKIRTEKWLYFGAIFLLVMLSGILLSFVTLYLFQFFILTSPRHSGIPRFPFHFGAYTFPYVWFILSGIAVLLAVYVTHKTPKGYRYKRGFLLAIATVGVFLFTLIFHLSHMNERAERFVNERAPGGFHSMTENQWNHPEEGFLGGRITSKERLNFDIETRGGETWKVITSDKTVFYGKKDVAVGSSVMISGQKQDKGIFMADTIKSTNISHGMNNEYHPEGNKGK